MAFNAFGGVHGVTCLRSVPVSVLADDGFIFGSDRLKNSGSVSDDKRDFLPVFRRGCRWSFILFGCMVCSDRRKVSGRVPCCMVSESRKMFYKSVSSVPGCISSGSLQGLRLAWSPAAIIQGAKFRIKSAVWSYSIFDELSLKRLILKYYVFYIWLVLLI